MSGFTADVFYTKDYTITPNNYEAGTYVMLLGTFTAETGDMLQLEIYYNGNGRVQSTAVASTTPSKLVIMLEVYNFDGTTGRNIYGYGIQHGTMYNDKIAARQNSSGVFDIYMYFNRLSYPFVHATTNGNWTPSNLVQHIEAISSTTGYNSNDFGFGDSNLPGSTSLEPFFKIPIWYKMKDGLIETTNGFNVSSSRRYKTNIEKLPENYNLDMVIKMRPIVYQKKGEPGNQTLYPGLIAEELHDLSGNLFILYQEGKPEALDYSRLTVLLISALQELNERLERLTRYFEEVKKKKLDRTFERKSPN